MKPDASKGFGVATVGTRGGVTVAAAVGTPTPAATDTGCPRKLILAGAIAGAVLVAIPLLLTGSANDDGRPRSANGPAADSTTGLNASSAPAMLDGYVVEKPSSPPGKSRPNKSEAPNVAVVRTAAPSPSSKASSSPEKKAKAKATRKSNWGTMTVYATSALQVGQAWSTNRIRMVMQSDGNLVVYNEKGKPIWAAMTFGANHRAVFQQDGNLVIHNADDRPIWASKSQGHEGAQLVLRADGKVVILHDGGMIWST
ncbi:mannose-binding protein [Streptomyces sp. NPDC058685]|uniref:mannose-binding protein n=1 Tax=Streptomyces sp. NPDC058685 TaxID=3346598 RepID=UPI003663F436